VNGEIVPGVGQRLADARESRGLALADVAAQLKLSLRQVEALEAEDFAQLPGEIFVRGFIRNYARLVDLDPGEFLPQVEVHVAEQVTAPSTNLRFRTSPVRRMLVIPIVGGILFFVLVALLYGWLKGGDGAVAPQGQPSAAPASVAPAPDQPALPEADPAETPAQAGGDPAAQAPEATAPVVPGLPASPPPARPPEPVKVPAEPARPAGASLLFQPGEDSWVQVVDARGQRYARLLQAGSSETFEGVPPFRLVVGNAGAMRLSYKGSPVDLRPHTGEKVARLTLGEGGPAEAGAAVVRPQPGARSP